MVRVCVVVVVVAAAVDVAATGWVSTSVCVPGAMKKTTVPCGSGAVGT